MIRTGTTFVVVALRPRTINHDNMGVTMTGAVSHCRELDTEVLIVGAGFGGIGVAIELLKSGNDDFLIIDRNSGVGGVWHTNTYPGVSVDVPSVLYSYSYAPPRKWTRFFPPGAEVKEYVEQVVDDFGIRDRIRLNNELIDARWDDHRHRWTARLASGETLVSRYLILGVGSFTAPKLPAIPGFEKYVGKVVHTASWDHDFDYRDKRIAVIGTGASALQLIPELSDVAAHLTVFQRRPIWVAPKPDFGVSPSVSAILTRVPLLRRVIRALLATQVDLAITGVGVFHGRMPIIISTMQRLGGIGYRLWLGDRALADRLTPRYAPYCKRPSVSNRYLRTFRQKHVELVTDPIRELTEACVVTADGNTRPADVVVCATGFDVMAHSTPPFPVFGRDGVELGAFWQQQRFQAYQGVTVPGFPNLFLVNGPYAYPGGSAIAMIECTSRHAVRAIGAARRRGATAVEIRQEPHERYWNKCLKRGRRTIWLSPRCDGSGTYVVNHHGDAVFIRPSLHWEMWWGNKHFPLDHYTYATALTAA